MNLLFICSRNQWRSRTAETIFKNKEDWQVRSAGTEKVARIRVSEKLINWADIIFVMEKKHQRRMEERFLEVLKEKEIIILDIPDDYQYMEEELVDMLEDTVGYYLK